MDAEAGKFSRFGISALMYCVSCQESVSLDGYEFNIAKLLFKFSKFLTPQIGSVVTFRVGGVQDAVVIVLPTNRNCTIS